jgi:hypothetical protein
LDKFKFLDTLFLTSSTVDGLVFDTNTTRTDRNLKDTFLCVGGGRAFNPDYFSLEQQPFPEE